MMGFNKGSQAGMSIVETLAAIAVFGIVAGGLAAGTMTTIRGNKVSRNMGAAAALLQDKVEQFRAVGSVADSAELVAGDHQDPGNPITPLGDTGGAFERSWSVSPSTPNPGLAKVEVTVSWSQPTAASISAVTLVCENSSCM